MVSGPLGSLTSVSKSFLLAGTAGSLGGMGLPPGLRQAPLYVDVWPICAWRANDQGRPESQIPSGTE